MPRLFSTGDTGTLLRDRDFVPYLAGNVISYTGTWFQILAQTILIYRLTNSTFLAGVLAVAQYAAVFLLAPVVGRVSDTFDQRRVLIITQLAATAVTDRLLCAVTAVGEITPALLIVFALILGVTNAFSTPVSMAFAPSLVGRAYLSAALALNSVSYNLGRAVGPVLAYLVIRYLGTAWAFGINSLSFLALVLGLMSVRSLTIHEPPILRARLRDSARIVMNDKRLVALLYTIAAMNLATDPPITLGPAFMTRVYHANDGLAGLLVGAFGAGALAAAFLFAHRVRGARLTLAAMLALTGGGIAVFAAVPILGFGLAGLFLMGVGYLATNTAATSRLQSDVDPAHRGRIMVLWSIAFLGARPVGGFIDGSIASWAGVRVAAAVMVVPALAGAAVFFVSGARARRLRKDYKGDYTEDLAES